jgi:hypothetical protein
LGQWIGAIKEQCKSNKNAQGTLRYDGPLHQKGNCYFVEIDFIGSGEGTSDKPKFALRSTFKKTIFPRIAKIIKPRGEYNG